jgi:SAM-dependent methyltransferase
VTEEYVNDVPYVRHFLPDLAPARLRLAAAVNGLAPPPGDEFDYCELGCAHGDTLAALAAAHPNARFLGVDISAAHIASAKRLARDGGLENIGFLERDFADLIHEDIGEFDFVVAYGVLTWVSPEKRKALLEFANARLKPGGLLYVTYNAMPGWGAVEPLRQLLLSPLGAPGSAAETSLERARRGLEFAQAMERAGADYFVKNPWASQMLATMTKAGLAYIIHEYLHDHWTPMYFARVAWEMASSDLHFVGVLPLFLNFKGTAVAESLEPMLAATKDRLTFESLKDFAINETFRRDIYVKGKVARSTDVTNAYLDETIWGAVSNTPGKERVEQLPHRPLTLDDPIFDPLFDALAEGAAPLTTLAGRRGLDTYEIDKLRAAMLKLALADRVLPLSAPTRAATIDDGRFSVPSVYNQMMLRRLSSDTPIVMTSTVAGTAFPMAALEGLAVRILTEAAPQDREQWIRDFLGRHVLRFAEGDRVIADRTEQYRVVMEKLDYMRTQRLSKLVELGILTPA